jgi:hypothetical protein
LLLADAPHQHPLEVAGRLCEIIANPNKLPGAFADAIAERLIAQQENGVPGEFLRGAAHQIMHPIPARYSLYPHGRRYHHYSRCHAFQNLCLDSGAQPQGQKSDLHFRKKGRQIRNKACQPDSRVANNLSR